MDSKFMDIIIEHHNYVNLISGSSEKEIFHNFFTKVDKSLIENWIEKTFAKQSVKDDKISESYRNDGNKYFKQNNYDLALKNYNNSLLYARHTSENFAFALANRSAVFFALKNYESCIKDIRVCLGHNYPDTLKYKIYLRLINCYTKLLKFNDVQREIAVLGKYLVDNTDLKDSLKEQILEDISNIQEEILENKKSMSDVKSISMDRNDNIILPVFEENKKFVNASNSITLKYNNSKGRHVIANSDIKVGDVLFVEKSFSSVPVLKDASNDKTFCYHCFVDIDCPIPCKNCKTVFCSLNCFEKSWNGYHRFECTGSCADFWVKIGVGFLGTRLLILGATSGYKNVFNVSQTQVEQFENHASYDNVCSLVNHVDKLDKYQIFLQVMSSLIITTYLKNKTDFFEYLDNFQITTENKQSLIGSILLKHLLQIIANSSAIQSVENDFFKKSLTADRTDFFEITGVGIYPSVSMMNHSCKPNISTYFINDHIIVKANIDIKKNSEIFNSYGCSYTTQETIKRKEQLKSQHFFECECTACTFPTLPEVLACGLLCQKCKGYSVPQKENGIIYECKSCKHVFNSSNHWIHLEKATNLFKKYKHTENTDYLKKSWEIREKVALDIELCEIAYTLMAFYENSDFHSWMEYMIRSIDLDILLFGENSCICVTILRVYSLTLLKFLKAFSMEEKNGIGKKTLLKYLEQVNNMLQQIRKLLPLYFDENRINFDEFCSPLYECITIMSQLILKKLYTNTVQDDIKELDISEK